jgi:hypothetical protein
VFVTETLQVARVFGLVAGRPQLCIQVHIRVSKFVTETDETITNIGILFNVKLLFYRINLRNTSNKMQDNFIPQQARKCILKLIHIHGRYAAWDIRAHWMENSARQSSVCSAQ